MKMLYISAWDMDPNGKFTGSAKKTISFVNSFNKKGIETQLYNSFKLIKETNINKILTRLPYFATFNKLEYSNELNGYDIYYIRFLGSDYAFTKFLRILRKNNECAKILIEFPDIDYMCHFKKSIKNMPYYLKDKQFIKKMHKYVDRVVLLGKSEYYHNVKCINIYNGINVDQIPIRTINVQNNDEVHFGAVASIQPVHGFDLFLKAIKEYYDNSGSRNIVFDLIGDGEGLNDLKNYAEKCGISEHVIFHGFKFGEELDEIYNRIDIGLCELAPFRRGYKISSSLKSREYLAKGLPIVTGVKIDVLEDKNFEYFLKLNNTEKELSLESCITFYDSLYNDDCNAVLMANEIRNFAKKNIDMEVIIGPILEYLDEN